MEQQAQLSVHRVRAHWVKQRTASVNVLRGLLYEFGVVIPKGRAHLMPWIGEHSAALEQQLPPAMWQLVLMQMQALRVLDQQIEAAQLPRTVQDVDFAVINGNYAMEAGFSVGKDALATEDASSEAAQTYANVLVVKEGRENDPAIQALYAALTSDKVKDYINSTYDGAVVPIF